MLLSIRNDTINTSGELVFIKYSTYSSYNPENIMHSDAEEEGAISTWFYVSINNLSKCV